VVLALEAGELETLTPIRVRISGELIDLTVARDDQGVQYAEVQTVDDKVINTTVGRVILNTALPKGMPFVNGLLKKKGLQQLVQYGYLRYGLEKTVEMLDSLKTLGLHLRHALGPVDRHRRPGHPVAEAGAGRGARDEVIKVEGQYLEGAHHQRRALQQGHRRVVGGHREDRRRDVLGRWRSSITRAATSTRSTSWPTRAREARSSRSASWRACAA
jgi:hypothetical protein